MLSIPCIVISKYTASYTNYRGLAVAATAKTNTDDLDCVYTQVCVCVCVCVYIYIYIYIYIYSFRILSDDRFKASPKTIPLHSAI